MSVGNVVKSGAGQFTLVDFDRHGLGLGELAEFIQLGHEVEVLDEAGANLTKETLVEIALTTVVVEDSDSARARLMQADEFDLHQMIEDGAVEDYLSS